MEKRTRVLLADANEEFRILLRQLLEETGEFEVAASTGDGPMVMELVRRTGPTLYSSAIESVTVLPKASSSSVVSHCSIACV